MIDKFIIFSCFHYLRFLETTLRVTIYMTYDKKNMQKVIVEKGNKAICKNIEISHRIDRKKKNNYVK